MKLRVCEIFTSIQGEGIWAGVPSTFIRLSGCNLRCAWCDTPYASWEPEGEMMELADITAQVRADHVVITGGEPMLFEGLVELCQMIKSGAGSFTTPSPCPLPLGSGGEGGISSSPREGEVSTRPAATEGLSIFEATNPHPSRHVGTTSPCKQGEVTQKSPSPWEGVARYEPGEGSVDSPEQSRICRVKITIETAGTRFLDLPCDLLSISPKLTNSIPRGGSYTGPATVRDIDPAWEQRHDKERINIDVLRQLVSSYSYQLKFVVTQPSDITEIEQLLDEIGSVDPSRVILMPEGVKSDKLHAGARALVPICLEKGWRLGPRMHIDLFGDTKGT